MDWYGNNVCTFGQKLYFDFAREWDYPYFWDKRLRKDFTVGPRYAYSHVNSLSSAAMTYLATKDESYRNFGDSVCVRDDKWGSCEVSCCSWAVFKLCNYLLMLTGEARFGDWGGALVQRLRRSMPICSIIRIERGFMSASTCPHRCVIK